MTVRDLTPEQRRELLAAWDAAVDAHLAVESVDFPPARLIEHRNSCVVTWHLAVRALCGPYWVLFVGPQAVGLGA